jgi:hypothetical protein
MARLSLYLIGIFAGVVAIASYRNRIVASRRIPATEAAARLREAWADSHTRV